MNVMSPTYLSKLAIKHLKKRKGRSLLVTVSSVIESHPARGFALYSSTKAYLTRLTTTLCKEINYTEGLADKIDTCIYSPGPVATKMTDIDFIPLINISALQAARSAVKDFGRLRT